MAEKWPSTDLDSLLTDEPWVEPEDTNGQLLVEYSFSKNTDDAERFPYTFNVTAKSATLSDGNSVVAIGNGNGYVDLSMQMGKTILTQIQTNHTIKKKYVCIYF